MFCLPKTAWPPTSDTSRGGTARAGPRGGPRYQDASANSPVVGEAEATRLREEHDATGSDCLTGRFVPVRRTVRISAA